MRTAFHRFSPGGMIAGSITRQCRSATATDTGSGNEGETTSNNDNSTTTTMPVQGSVCHHYVNDSSQSPRSLRVESTNKMATLFAGRRCEYKRNCGTRAVLSAIVLPPCSSAPDNDISVVVDTNVHHSNGNYRPKGGELKSSLLSNKVKTNATS